VTVFSDDTVFQIIFCRCLLLLLGEIVQPIQEGEGRKRGEREREYELERGERVGEEKRREEG
jgi:hypothetical protein